MGYLTIPIGVIILVVYIIILTNTKKTKQVLLDIDELKIIQEKIPIILSEEAVKKMRVIVEEIENKYPKNAKVIALVDIIKNDLYNKSVSIVNKYQNLHIDDTSTN